MKLALPLKNPNPKSGIKGNIAGNSGIYVQE